MENLKGHSYGDVCKKCGKIHQHPKGMKGKEHNQQTKNQMAKTHRGKTSPKEIAWLSEDEFVHRIRLLIPDIPRCVCGNKYYRFSPSLSHIQAKCNNCGALFELVDRWGKFVDGHGQKTFGTVFRWERRL